MQNKHWALVDRGLLKINDRCLHAAAKPMLEFLENKMTDMNTQNTNFVAILYMGSCTDKKAVATLSLRKRADVIVSYGQYGTSFKSSFSLRA